MAANHDLATYIRLHSVLVRTWKSWERLIAKYKHKHLSLIRTFPSLLFGIYLSTLAPGSIDFCLKSLLFVKQTLFQYWLLYFLVTTLSGHYTSWLLYFNSHYILHWFILHWLRYFTGYNTSLATIFHWLRYFTGYDTSIKRLLSDFTLILRYFSRHWHVKSSFTMTSSWIRVCFGLRRPKVDEEQLDERFGDLSISAPTIGGWNQVPSTSRGNDTRYGNTGRCTDRKRKDFSALSPWTRNRQQQYTQAVLPQCHPDERNDSVSSTSSSESKNAVLYKPASDIFLKDMARIGNRDSNFPSVPENCHYSPCIPPSRIPCQNSLEPQSSLNVPCHPSHQQGQLLRTPGMQKKNCLPASPRPPDKIAHSPSPAPSMQKVTKVNGNSPGGSSMDYVDIEKRPRVLREAPKHLAITQKDKKKPVTQELVPSSADLFGWIFQTFFFFTERFHPFTPTIYNPCLHIKRSWSIRLESPLRFHFLATLSLLVFDSGDTISSHFPPLPVFSHFTPLFFGLLFSFSLFGGAGIPPLLFSFSWTSCETVGLLIIIITEGAVKHMALCLFFSYWYLFGRLLVSSHLPFFLYSVPPHTQVALIAGPDVYRSFPCLLVISFVSILCFFYQNDSVITYFLRLCCCFVVLSFFLCCLGKSCRLS